MVSLRKKEVYTIITPIPSFIPRQLAIDILHSHGEVITLNPLVLSYKQIKAPRDAATDEFFSTWYEITERLQFVPGMGRLGSGKIVFNSCFHDLPWGLQTHVYAPLNIDLRNKYRIAGNQPGVEPPEPPEIGLAALGVPKDGLYLREDIEIRCNITMVGMVKAQMKAASKEMVDRIIKKAELLDSGALRAMIEDGRMRTFNPNDKTYTGGLTNASSSEMMTSPPQSPRVPYQQQFGQSPSQSQLQQQPPMSPSIPYQVPRPISTQSRPGTASSQGYPAHWQAQQQQTQASDNKIHQQFAELAPQTYNTQKLAPPPLPQRQQQQGVVMELPGDFYHPQTSPQFRSSHSSTSNQSHSPDPSSQGGGGAGGGGGGGWRWSGASGISQGGQPSPSLSSSRPTSYSSDPGGGVGGVGSAPYGSPALDHKGFSAELPTHAETQEEHRPYNGVGVDHSRVGGPQPAQKWGYSYNPADYARNPHR